MDTVRSDKDNKKSTKVRSVKYPSLSLLHCIDTTIKIKEKFSDITYIPRSDISNGIDSSGGALDRTLSSCVQYGLLEMKSGDGYKPTELFNKIRKPLPNEDVRDFHIQCLRNAPLYKKLFEAFANAELPEKNGLANILDRLYQVKGEASEKAASIFFRNLKDIELIGEDGKIKLDDSFVDFEELPGEERSQPDNGTPLLYLEQPKVEPPQPPAQAQKPQIGTRELPVFLDNGREAKIILPDDFTDEDMKRIRRAISVYLPE